MIKNLVLGGCQLKGLAFIGAIKYFEELKIIDDIENVCGVSSGSIFALGLCLGFNSEELKAISLKLSIDDLRSTINNNVFKLFENFGFDNGSQFVKLFKIIIEKKTGNSECTFKELEKFTGNKNLIVIGTNLTLCKSELFSKDTTPDMKVYEALRISISFPLVFTKVCLNTYCYVDGGVMANFPIDFFKDDIDKTIGIVVNSKKDLSIIETFDQYLLRILYILSFQKQELLCEKYSDQSVKIVVDYSLLSISFTEEKKEYLIEEGYRQFKENFNYEFYYKKQPENIENSENLIVNEITSNVQSLVESIKDEISIDKNINKLNNIIENI